MSTFARVREAFVSNLEANLRSFGIEIRGQPKGDWQQVICPLCSDTNGSCDISIKSGHLNCKQCNRNEELFTWTMALSNTSTTWDQCRLLADSVGVSIEIEKKRGRTPRHMEESDLLNSIDNLWTQDVARPARDFLAQRGLTDPEILSMLGVGYLGGCIVFAQRWPNGTLKPRYRRYNPGAAKHKRWGWSPGKAATQGIWPAIKPHKDGTILLLEGEWDVCVAWDKLRLQDQGIYAYTWTGGVKAIPPQELPDWFRSKTVDICYDNDTFQGPSLHEHVAPSEQKLAEMVRRRDAMMRTAEALAMLKCHVRIRAVPIDPAVQWGGDFRDWVEAGGRDLNEIPSWTLKQIEKANEGKVHKTDFDGVFKLAGERVEFEAVVQAIEEEGFVFPILSSLDCSMGSESFCTKCRAPERFPGSIISHKDYLAETIAAIRSRDPERVYHKELIGKPSACSFARTESTKYRTMTAWVAVSNDLDETSDRELIVLSEQHPTLSGRITVRGKVYHHKKHLVVLAEELIMKEATDLDLKPLAQRLEEITPWNTNDVDQLDRGIRRHAQDLAQHVTLIFGRAELHISALLLANSALWMEIDGHRKRAWLDIAVIGSTSTGKSMTFQHIFNHHGLGRMHTCVENVSRAGLTIGAIQAGDKMRLKPGLFPRSHKGMLVLDEFHLMVEERKDHPMLHLQSARDLGHVGGIKIYGARQLPAAVRLATIANWIDGRRDTRKFPCQHLLDLYGKPESLRRLDFGLVVDGDTVDDHGPVDHQWVPELEQATILRAWGQRPEDIRIHPEALKDARATVERWGDAYADELPLFTGIEKVFSILRVAIAVANCTFSHPRDDIRVCEVRPVHVKWAARWFEEIWALSQYDEYSQSQFSKRELKHPYHVEAAFTTKLKISDPERATNLLDNLFNPMSLQELQVYLGDEMYRATTWASELVRLGAYERTVGQNRYHVTWRLTPGAHALLTDIVDLATDFPAEFVKRVEKLGEWATLSGMRDDCPLPPIHDYLRQLRTEWDTEPPTNVVGGPGSR